jgi:hypothetical protein
MSNGRTSGIADKWKEKKFGEQRDAWCLSGMSK